MIKSALFLAFVGLSFYAYYYLAWFGLTTLTSSSINFPIVPVLAATAGGVFYVWVEIHFSKNPYLQDESTR